MRITCEPRIRISPTESLEKIRYDTTRYDVYGRRSQTGNRDEQINRATCQYAESNAPITVGRFSRRRRRRRWKDTNNAVTRPSKSPSWSASQDVEARADFNYRAAERAAIQGYANRNEQSSFVASFFPLYLSFFFFFLLFLFIVVIIASRTNAPCVTPPVA